MRKLLFLSIILFSCADTETNDSSVDTLTVEGQIREGRFAEIRLTNSLPFRGVIDSIEVAKSIESKAKVVLSNGQDSEILTLKRDDSSFPFLYYRSNSIKGEIDKTYNLSVSIRGKEFISETTIPEASKVLNVEFLEWIEDGVINPDFRDIKLTIDNKTFEDRYFKILVKKESEENFELARPFIFSTENIITETFPVVVSYIRLSDVDGKKENQIMVGDVVELKLVAITKEQFDFWKSVNGDETTPLENSSFTNKIITNISNGAFGYWSGESLNHLKFDVD